MMILYQQKGQGLVDDRGKDVTLFAKMTQQVEEESQRGVLQHLLLTATTLLK